MRWFLSAVDTANDWIGRSTIYITMPLMLIIAFEVGARYIFHSPTIWSWDLSSMLQGVILGLGGGYALLHGLHVRVDVLVSRMRPRQQEIIDLLVSLPFFLGIGLLEWNLSEATWRSVTVREHLPTLWGPPIYPLKIIVSVGVFLMLLQGLARFLRGLRAIFGGRS